MKYKLEFCPNPDVIQIHLLCKKRLFNSIQSFESPDDKVERWKGDRCLEEEPPSYVKRLWEVSGLISITVTQYEIQLEKGSAFNWNKMLPQIISILNLELFPEQEPTEIAKPKKPSKKLLASLRKQGCDV